MNNNKPIWESRRFITAVAAAVGMALVAYFPVFSSVEDQLVTGIAAVAGLVIFGYSVDNLAIVVATAKTLAAQTESTLDDQIAAGVAGALEAAGIIPPTAKGN